jgi:hypothetical protein
MTPAEILLKAADGFRTGQIQWGVGWFHDPRTDCRCALGGIAWAAAPDDEDGNPFFLRMPAADDAARALAQYLIDTDYAIAYRDLGYEERIVGTVGNWNDDTDTTIADVIAVLEAAAALAEATA